MDKEDVLYVQRRILLSLEKYEILSIKTIQMDLEEITISDIEILNIHEWLAIALTVQKMIGSSLSPVRELIRSSNNQEQQHSKVITE